MDPRLLEAASRGDTMQLQNLLKEDSFMLERCSLAQYPETVLHVSAMAGQTDFLKEILKLKPDLATRLNRDGFNPIHIASANGNVEMVKELLRTSNDLGRLRSSDGRSSLHFAATTGRIQVIKELIDFCPEWKDDVTIGGETALHLAVKNDQFEAVKVLVDKLKEFNIKELLNARDEDGNTILHIATARKQCLTLKLLLGGNDIEQGAVEVNITNKTGLTALDLLDVQEMMIEPPGYMLRELLLRKGALRGSALRGRDTTQIDHDGSSIIELDQNLQHFMLKKVLLLNPFRRWKKLAEEVKHSSSEIQNALVVVAVLIAAMTYQGILNPPNGIYKDKDDKYTCANIAFSITQFVLFMGPNTVGFFASLAVIILLIHEFPLKVLLGLAVRCMAANYVSGLLLIGPTEISATHFGATIVGIFVLVDLFRFGYWLLKRWTKELRSHSRNGTSAHGA